MHLYSARFNFLILELKPKGLQTLSKSLGLTQNYPNYKNPKTCPHGVYTEQRHP
jgi:hypothetical protein